MTTNKTSISRHEWKKIPIRQRYRVADGSGIVPASDDDGPVSPTDASRAELAVSLGQGLQTIDHTPFSGTGDAAPPQTVQFLGGKTLGVVGVKVIFWGREWANSPPINPGVLLNDVKAIVTGPYLDAVRQYGVSGADLDRAITVADSDPPNPFTTSDIGNFVLGLIENDTFPEPDDEFSPSLYTVFLPQTVAGNPLVGPAGANGAHSFATFSDFDFPFDIDNDNIYFAWVKTAGRTRASISGTFSHELVEAMTDPEGTGWQIVPTNSTNWNEISDICASALSVSGTTVRAYWSASDNACVVPVSRPTGYRVEWIYKPSAIGHIEWLGGTREDGLSWQKTRNQVMDLIFSGDRFVVHGSVSGQESVVGVFWDPSRGPFKPYLATSPDSVKDDNLLALPERHPS